MLSRKNALLTVQLLIVLALLLASFLNFKPFIQTVKAEPYFSENFNDGVADGWTPRLGSWRVMNGEYFVSVGDNGISTLNGLNLTDCVIETQLRFTDSVGYKAGIVFRYSDNSHYYAFEIGNEYDHMEIIKYSPASPDYGESQGRAFIQPLYGNSSLVINANVNYTLRIEIQGSNFNAYLDGQKVLSWTDSSYNSGLVGLRARRADANFENFKIESASAQPSPTPQPSTKFSPISIFFYSPKIYTVNEVITFDASRSSDPDGRILQYQWDFGDGKTSAENTSQTTHTYKEAGNYNVSLTVTDNDGLKITTTKSITIGEMKIKRSIEYNFETLAPYSVRVTLGLKFEIGDSPVEDAIVKVNQVTATHLGNGLYSAVLNTLMPYLTINTIVERKGTLQMTSETTVYPQGNVIVWAISIAFPVLIANFWLYKRKKKWADAKAKLAEIVLEKGRISLSDASQAVSVKTKIKKLLTETISEKQGLRGYYLSNGGVYIIESLVVSLVANLGKFSLEDFATKIGSNVEEAKEIISKLQKEHKINGTFTVDGKSFITEERLIEDIGGN